MTEQGGLKGLTLAQVEASRARYGRNVMTAPKGQSLWLLYLEKLKDPMIVILLVALLLSFVIAFVHYASDHQLSCFLEPLGILFAVILATTISFYFEVKANGEFKLLNEVSDETLFKVLREGAMHQVAKSELVVGDILFVETGDELPADGHLLEAVSLQVNESSLTGEPLANKYAERPSGSEDTPYPADCLYRGTVVIEGHGILEITAVGDSTEAGKVFRGLSLDTEVQTPLQQQLARLARFISYAGFSVAALLIAARVVYFFIVGMQSGPWLEIAGYFLNSVMLAVTLLVIAVPEGLPMSVSLSLAASMRSMLKNNNLVRKMHACETMGAATVICTDKTGTLTLNQMRVGALFGPDGRAVDLRHPLFSLLAQAIAVNSTAFLETHAGQAKKTVLGNPTEGALLLWLDAQGVDFGPLRRAVTIAQQIPFSTERKYMATVVKGGTSGARTLYVKGAPEVVLAMCRTVYTNSESLAQLEDYEQTLMHHLVRYQQQGMRTLAFACYTTQDAQEELVTAEHVATDKLSLLALAAISDPVRQDVPPAIKECMEAGVSVKIVTGDTLLTTQEIARQIGLWDASCTPTNAMSGAEFAARRDEELLPLLQGLRIMYRARPLDKQRLTRLLQSQGEVVAVTGDGTNDAPALKAAQVGLSMGDGTAVAKEASDITILDNSFVSIGKAILWGRSLYANIQRFLVFQLTINVVACLIVLLGALTGIESPLTITQMLWINLIMDTFAALAFASLPPDRAVMRQKPRSPKEHILTASMRFEIIFTGIYFLLLLVGMLWLFNSTEWEPSKPLMKASFYNDLLNGLTPLVGFSKGTVSPYELSLFFNGFIFLQLWNMFSVRILHTHHAFWQGLSKCRRFLMVALFIFVVQWCMMAMGGQLFNLVPISIIDQLWEVVGTAMLLLIGELLRLVARRTLHRGATAR